MNLAERVRDMTIEQLTAAVMDLEQRISAYDERSRAAICRLDTIEREVKDQRKLLVVVERLANGISNLTTKVEHLDTRVEVFGNRINLLELKPSKNLDKIKWVVVTTLLTAGITYMVTKLLGGIP